MSDQQPQADAPEIEPLNFTQHLVITADRWPARTSFSVEWLDHQAHVYGAVVEGETVRFEIGNGTAVYVLRYDLDPVDGNIVADLNEGDEPGALRRKRARFEDAPMRRLKRGR